MHTKCRDRDSQFNFKYLKTTRVIWCHFLSTWVTPVCGLGFLPSRPWDEELGAIIYLRGDPGGTVKGWSSDKEGRETSRGWTNYCVTMVGNWDSGLWEAMWNMPACGSWNFYPSTPISHWWRCTPGPKNMLRQKDAGSHRLNGNWLPLTYRVGHGHVGRAPIASAGPSMALELQQGNMMSVLLPLIWRWGK